MIVNGMWFFFGVMGMFKIGCSVCMICGNVEIREWILRREDWEVCEVVSYCGFYGFGYWRSSIRESDRERGVVF